MEVMLVPARVTRRSAVRQENDYSYKQRRILERSIYDLLLASISTVFGCGVIPGGQTSTRTFTASGPSNLPVIAVYTDNNKVSALIPGIATSKDAVQAFAQRFAMQTPYGAYFTCKTSPMPNENISHPFLEIVKKIYFLGHDVLEIEGRRALLPDFVISNILGQLQVNTTYEPLLCKDLKRPEIPRKSPVVEIHLADSNPNYKGNSKSRA
ncbi:hypothetical protein KIN20_007768 [Parelaphostrongylus tenuis]|uniref:Uncharacterized protein n=1 Tax=Parelaphostrongylus tenuis TaxID=148309 RepID=A0AAD5QH22_PARTN|nr:hypothetical protein KIN20_007768 [Parelaphostrongylus tenuis]